MDEHLRVGTGPEAVSDAGQFPPQLLVIPDLAVVHGDDRSVLARHRLAAVLEVDDAESCAPEGGRAVDVVAGLVRTAVCQSVNGLFQTRRIRRFGTTGRDDADKAAHRTNLRNLRTFWIGAPKPFR